jgi:hypothetical protein
MHYTNKKYDGLFLCIFLIICIAPFVGFRDYSIGSDTPAYARHISEYLLGIRGDSKRWEPGIYALASFSGLFSNSPQLFFTFHFILLSSVMLFAYRNFVKDNKNLSINFQLIAFTIFLFFSKWFITAATNNLRQSMALAFIFLGLSYFKKNNFKMIGSILIGLSWHYSVLLVLLFLIFLPFSINYIIFLTSIFAILYITGLNGLIIEFLSNLFSLPVYEFILSYADSQKYIGFQPTFFLYTAFWPILVWGLNNIFGYKSVITFKSFFKENDFVFKIYLILIMSYFIFGFGPYVTRYSYPAWLFLPFLFTFYFSSLGFKRDQKKSIVLIMSPVAITYFLYLVVVGY